MHLNILGAMSVHIIDILTISTTLTVGLLGGLHVHDTGKSFHL
jgi:hypothetical protein